MGGLSKLGPPARRGGPGLIQVAAGDDHTVLLLDNGQALACGNHGSGQTSLPDLHASEQGGIQLRWVLRTFPGDVQRIAGRAAEDMDFIEMAPIMAYGADSYGKGVICPRDDKMDCSIVDAVCASGYSSKATLFLSWVWRYKLGLVLSALKEFQDRHAADPAFSGESCYLWWCFFNNNQHRILGDGRQMTTDELSDIFGSRLKSVGTMVCMMDRIQGSSYTSRIWCDFEVFIAERDGIPMEVMLPSTCRQEMNAMFMAGGLDFLKAGLTVNSELAEATSKDDERNIKSMIQTQSSFAAVNVAVEKSLAAALGHQIVKALGVETASQSAASDLGGPLAGASGTHAENEDTEFQLGQLRAQNEDFREQIEELTAEIARLRAAQSRGCCALL
jgi:hypothetical protein